MNILNKVKAKREEDFPFALKDYLNYLLVWNLPELGLLNKVIAIYF